MQKKKHGCLEIWNLKINFIHCISKHPCVIFCLLYIYISFHGLDKILHTAVNLIVPTGIYTYMRVHYVIAFNSPQCKRRLTTSALPNKAASWRAVPEEDCRKGLKPLLHYHEKNKPELWGRLFVWFKLETPCGLRITSHKWLYLGLVFSHFKKCDCICCSNF